MFACDPNGALCVGLYTGLAIVAAVAIIAVIWNMPPLFDECHGCGVPFANGYYGFTRGANGKIYRFCKPCCDARGIPAWYERPKG